jgi:hypothetical protein
MAAPTLSYPAGAVPALDTKLDAVLEVGGKRRSYTQLFPLESVGRDPEAA